MVDRADLLQKRAYQIVAETRILELWKKVGKTYLVGSMRFGLMTVPNIDMEIYVEKPDVREGFAVMSEIALLSGVVRIQYHNFLSTADPGLYWRVDYEDGEGVLWDFDNWLVPFDHPQAGMADAFATAMTRTLTQDLRRMILGIKSAIAGWGPEKKPRGIDIYKAVLEGGVRSEEEFVRWQIQNPPEPMETWRPGA